MTDLLIPQQLHEYQKVCVMHQLTNDDSMLWVGLGLGKTPITLTTIIDRMRAGQVKKTLIFGPLRVIQAVWARESRKWSHTNHLRFSVIHGTKEKRSRALFADADIYLINYENMNWLAEQLNHYYLSQGKPLPFEMVVYDECFVKGTLISMDEGSKPINEIEIGDSVKTHDGIKRVTNVIKKSTFSLVSVKLSNGNRLKVTLNHPFLVNGKWVPACKLKEGDMLHDETQYSSVRTYTVPNLPDYFLEKKRGIKVLFKTMLDDMESETTCNAKISQRKIGSKTGSIHSQEWSVECWNTAHHRIKKENVRVTEEKLQSDRFFKWRKRNWRITLRKSTTHSAAFKLYNRVYSVIKTSPRWLSDTLQNRFWRPITKVRDRSTREHSSICTRERERCEKIKQIGRVRVESAVHIKQRCSTPVWNLSVSESETYFAGGVLVHNCSKLKNSTTLRVAGGNRDRKDGRGETYKIKVTGWRKILSHFKYRTGLTGTPASNGYLDLHGQFLAVDGGERLGEFITHYKDSYFTSDYNGWNYSPTELGKQWIEFKISDITVKMDARDYLDLPDCQVTNIMVDLPSAARKAYKEMEKKMFTQLDNGAELEVFSRSSVSNKCLQIVNGNAYISSGSSEYEIVHDAKLNALEEVLEEAGGSPVLCSYAFRADAERIMKKFKKYRPVNLTEVPSKDTEKVVNRWNRGDIKLLIGHPASMSYGIDGLQKSGHILVWFGLNWSLELYEQMCGRINRQGQSHPVSIIRILCNDTIDLAVADAIERKTDDQEGLKAALQRYREGVTTNELEINFF